MQKKNRASHPFLFTLPQRLDTGLAILMWQYSPLLSAQLDSSTLQTTVNGRWRQSTPIPFRAFTWIVWLEMIGISGHKIEPSMQRASHGFVERWNLGCARFHFLDAVVRWFFVHLLFLLDPKFLFSRFLFQNDLEQVEYMLNCFPFCPQNPRWRAAPSHEVEWTPMKLSHVILPSYSLRSIFWSGGTWWNWLAAWVGVVKAIDGNRFCQEAGLLAGRHTRRASFFGGVTRNSGKQQARCTKGNGLRARSRRGHRDALSHKFHQIPQDDSIL